jgi:hypothetical protein
MIANRIARLSRMSAVELQWRAGTAVRNTVDRTRARLHPPQWDRRVLTNVLAGPAAEQARRDAEAGRWVDAHKRLAESILEPPSRFVIAPMMRETMAARIVADFPAAARDAAVRAERILAGEYSVLGYRGLRFDAADGTTPDWHLDPVHGQRAPQMFWSQVPFLDRSCGDHKIIWELNRHQHFLSLGRAYWLTGDERFRAEAVRQIGSLIRSSPSIANCITSSRTSRTTSARTRTCSARRWRCMCAAARCRNSPHPAATPRPAVES